MKLEGKRALVTGGSRGIGRGIALAFAAEGADVAVGYRRQREAAEEAVKEVERLGRRGFAFAADVCDAAAVEAMVAGARDALGGPYVAAKAAVNALSKVVARENATRNVRCNVIAPGLIRTDIAEGMLEFHGEAIVRSIPLGRLGTPEEVGRLAAYLASDEAAWITGKVFRIDGGQW